VEVTAAADQSQGYQYQGQWIFGGGAFVGGERSCYRQQILTSKAEAETIVYKKVMDFVAIVMIFMVLLGME
jgi:hypothetical protein